jgi:hypothetical protein
LNHHHIRSSAQNKAKHGDAYGELSLSSYDYEQTYNKSGDKTGAPNDDLLSMDDLFGLWPEINVETRNATRKHDGNPYQDFFDHFQASQQQNTATMGMGRQPHVNSSRK